MSAFLTASTQPDEDCAILGRAHAVIRPLSALERRFFKGMRIDGERWGGAGCVIVLKACLSIQTIIVASLGDDLRTSQDGLDRLITSYVFGNQAGRAISRSSAVISIALRLIPDLEAVLQGERAAERRCAGCNCIWKSSGALDPGSAENESVRTILCRAEPTPKIAYFLQTDEAPDGE